MIWDAPTAHPIFVLHHAFFTASLPKVWYDWQGQKRKNNVRR
jgi:hypothetical protein